MSVRVQCVSLAEASCVDVVVVAAAGGDLDTLTRYLQYHPEYVSLSLAHLWTNFQYVSLLL